MSENNKNMVNGEIGPFADQDNFGNRNIGDIPITPDMVLRLANITESMTVLFRVINVINLMTFSLQTKHDGKATLFAGT